MRRRPDRRVAVLLALLVTTLAGAGEPFERFAERLGLRATLRTWQIDRLRGGAAAARREAARALGNDPVLLAPGTLGEAERREVLRLLVSALPASDASAARVRLELARQSLVEVSVLVDALRVGDPDPSAMGAVRTLLAQAGEILEPILAQRGPEPVRSDPLAQVRDPAWLLEGWRITLGAWIEIRDGQAPNTQLQRAVAIFAGLLDSPIEAAKPDLASVDLLRSELGADAGLGLATALQLSRRPEPAQAWLQAVEQRASATQAARRVAATRLAFAIDMLDASAMRAAIECVPARGLAPSLAIAAAQAAAMRPGPDAAAVIAAALDAMDGTTRAVWLGRLAASAGPLQRLATVLARAGSRLDTWRQGGGDPAEAAALAAEIDGAIGAEAGSIPAVLRAEALRLRAFALRSSGETKAASSAFERAASESPAMRGECLWLAALCEEGTDAGGRMRRIALLERQRQADPSGPYAGRAATWLSRLGGFSSDALAIAVLLEVRESDAFVADARAEAARRMLAAAGRDSEALQVAGRRALQALEPHASKPGVARWRLAAAIACEDLVAAGQAEAALSPTERGDPAVAASVAWLALLQGDAQRACVAIEGLPEAQRPSAAAAACARLSSMQSGEAREAEVRLACIAAELSAADARAAAGERLAQAVLRGVDAGRELPAPIASRAAAVLARVEPSRVQRAALGESLRMAGRAADSIEPLQALGSSLQQGSEAWAEARWRLYRSLLAVDASRAQAMLRQHMSLAPDGGPPPWGPLFVQAVGGAAP